MVRLEKLVYEQVVNNQTLKRARVLAAPSKWYNEDRGDVYKVAAHKLFCEGLTAKIFKWLEPALAWMTYGFPRDHGLQRGLALEDYFLFRDRELRRDYFFDTVARESLHPYSILLIKARRMRYYKVDRAFRGFYVPDYIRKEAEDRLYSDTVVNMEIWNKFVYKNFMSDMTPNSRWAAVPRMHPLEVFNVYGWFKPEAWERYFFNETYYDKYSAEDLKKAMNPFSQFNLETKQGREDFEAEVKRLIKLYPGSIVRVGEEFNFKEFYVRYALDNKKDVSQFDKKDVDKMKNELEVFSNELKDAVLWKKDKNVTKKKVAVGSILPEFMRPGPGKGLM